MRLILTINGEQSQAEFPAAIQCQHFAFKWLFIINHSFLIYSNKQQNNDHSLNTIFPHNIGVHFFFSLFTVSTYTLHNYSLMMLLQKKNRKLRIFCAVIFTIFAVYSRKIFDVLFNVRAQPPHNDDVSHKSRMLSVAIFVCILCLKHTHTHTRQSAFYIHKTQSLRSFQKCVCCSTHPLEAIIVKNAKSSDKYTVCEKYITLALVFHDILPFIYF